MAGIFISYRRADAEGWAGRLSDSLKAELGRVNIFRDIEDIPPGVEFDTYITDAVGACDVLIALIGPRWLTVTDSAGNRRLDDPKDFTRLEIVGALTRNVRVIPTLVGGATMPRADDLPEDLRPLVRRQAYELSDARWAQDCRRLCDVLKPIVKREGGLNRTIMAGVLAAVAIGGVGVWRWYGSQDAVDRQGQVEEPTIAAESRNPEAIPREQPATDAGAVDTSRQDDAGVPAEVQTKAEESGSAREQETQAVKEAIEQAVARVQASRDRSVTIIDSIAAWAREGSELAQRARSAAVSAGRLAPADDRTMESISRARDTAAKASIGLKNLKIVEEDAQRQFAELEKIVADAERSRDANAAMRGGELAAAAEKSIGAAGIDVEKQLHMIERLTLAAEDMLTQLAAESGRAAVDSSGGNAVIETGDEFEVLAFLTSDRTPGPSASDRLTVAYRVTLASTDRAILAIYLEQYP
jgi:hypothetical protein